MASSPLEQWLGGPYMVLLREPEGERIHGILRNLVPEQFLTLDKAIVTSTNQIFEHLNISAANVKDIIPLQTAVFSFTPIITPAVEHVTTPSQQTSSKPPFQDPAIVSMSRKPEPPSHGDVKYYPQSNTGEKRDPAVITNPADRLTYSSPDESDTTATATTTVTASSAALIAPMTQLSLSPTNPAKADTTEDELLDLTPTKRSSRGQNERKRGKRGKRLRGVKHGGDDGSPKPSTRPTNQGKGWRQTPILQSTKSFQPFASLKKSQKTRADPNADNGWASEDVTDVQEAGDFDFEGGLAKFDKRTIFNEMREQDQIDEAERLVSHNRVPRPKPGTLGGKNLHYSENVLDMASPAPKFNETPGDFWKSEADDDNLNGGEGLSGREGSGRNSRLRGESRVSTSRRSQSRKASAAASVGGPSRVNSGQPTSSYTLQGLYAVPSNRRIETVTHLQMLVVENVAHNELGLTEDLMAENAGRGITEVAMCALNDPATKLRTAATSPPNTSTIVVLAGNNKSGVRAISAARHLRNRGINVLVCVVGIERERELLEDIRKQVRLFRNFGGAICSKADLFEHLTQSNTTLRLSSQASVTLIIDALLGLTISFEELRKSDQATTYELMEWANRNDAFVIAIDIPSGVEPSSGKVNVIDGAKLYIHPRYVVALGAPKQGLVKALEMGDEQGDILMVDEWKIYLVDIGLGALVWRKAATKIRRSIDFDDKWVMELQYQPRIQED
ncbi:YjeF-related protein N-terminus-domain-containing protein [Biscogniauxia marginata]|nr:YjeF-related protein N-terminus-domain-containing protein [Biscogniauxia marginata]